LAFAQEEESTYLFLKGKAKLGPLLVPVIGLGVVVGTSVGCRAVCCSPESVDHSGIKIFQSDQLGYLITMHLPILKQEVYSVVGSMLRRILVYAN
jgi:hypothetical protein